MLCEEENGVVKVKSIITICTQGRSANKKGEERFTPTKKLLEPLRLKRIDFSKEIISNLQTKTSDRAGDFLWGVIFGCSFRN